MNALPVFLSAYDPAELPGGSVDPLGFTGGYLALADQLFPGMTAAAGQGTYLPVLCAGLQIAGAYGKLDGASVAAARNARVGIALRFERLWALACVLHAEARRQTEEAEAKASDGTDDVEVGDARLPGLRGVTYVEKERQRLVDQRARRAGTEFALLAQQYRYGMFGIYGGVAEELRLIDKATLAATRGFGDVLGQSFLEQTTTQPQQKELLKAVLQEGNTIALDTLHSWGQRAFVGIELTGVARERLQDALVSHPVRRIVLEALQTVAPPEGTTWPELEWLAAIRQQLERRGQPHLPATIEAVLAYDAFLRNFTLLFERTLWRCRAAGEREALSALAADPVVVETVARLPELGAAVVRWSDVLVAHGKVEVVRRGRGIVEVARRASELREERDALRLVLKRHGEIQRAKVERGRPKQPWVQLEGTDVALTSTGFGGRSSELRSPFDVRAPNWRVGAALSFLEVAGGLPMGVAS